ncbi:hypothetical protein D9M71_772560 [compost metagenome]
MENLRMYQLPAWWEVASMLRLAISMRAGGFTEDAEMAEAAWAKTLSRCERVVGRLEIQFKEPANA